MKNLPLITVDTGEMIFIIAVIALRLVSLMMLAFSRNLRECLES